MLPDNSLSGIWKIYAKLRERRFVMKIGILTSGGDCPGLNAVIRGFAKYVFNNIKDAELIGISEGY